MTKELFLFIAIPLIVLVQWYSYKYNKRYGEGKFCEVVWLVIALFSAGLFVIGVLLFWSYCGYCVFSGGVK